MQTSVRQVRRALDFLRAANRALALATDEQALLAQICTIAVEVGGHRFAWVGYAQHDPEKTVRFMASAGHHRDYLDRIRISWSEGDTGRGPAGIAIRTGQASIIQDLRNNATFAPWLKPALEFGYESAIALPLAWRNDTFGCLVMLSAEHDAFDEYEAGLLEELAASLSYGIQTMRTAAEHARAKAELLTERDTQQTLRKILSLSLEDISLEEKLGRTLDLLFDVDWLSLERKGAVFLADPDRKMIRMVSSRNLSPELLDKCANLPFGRCLCGKAAESGELLFRNRLDADHEIGFDGMPDHGHYCQPIHSRKGLVGLLSLYVGAGYQPQPQERPFLGAVADALAGVIERELTEQARQRLVTILEATPDLVTVTDPEGRCLYANKGARSVCDVQGANGSDASIQNIYPGEAGRRLRREAYPKAIASGIWEGELTLRRPDGQPLPVSLLVMAHQNKQNGVDYLSTVARDISDRKRAEEAARSATVREKNFTNILINSLPGIFYLVDQDLRFLRWNGNLESILGYPTSLLRTMHLRDIVLAGEWPNMERSCTDILELGKDSMEVSLVSCGGLPIPFHINGIRIDGGEAGTTIVGLGIDISYRKRLEAELRLQATTDALTGIANRLKIEQVLAEEIRKTSRYGSTFSIGMFDLDLFKRVNDTYGHDTGDEVLKHVATTVRMSLRDVDLLARWGGEEFMIIASRAALEDMVFLMERVRGAIAGAPFEGVGRITISAGVAEYKPGESCKDFLKRADDALYQAKEAGRNRVIESR